MSFFYFHVSISQASNIHGDISHTSSSSGTYTLGFDFTPNKDIVVTGVRRYFGTKISIWRSDGTLLASKSVSGTNGVWTEINLDSSITLSSGTSYRIATYTGGSSYYYQNGITYPLSFTDVTINMSYEGSGDAFPTTTDSAKWFVDIVYSTGSSDDSLETNLQNLNSYYYQITNVIPNRYDFSEGETGTSISDGGTDMYDTGNFINTNNYSSISYSNNSIVSHSGFGSGGRYFTRKYTGLFVLAADINIDYLEITGNLGADGSGNVDATVLSSTVNGVTYYGFVKRVYNAGDSSINHIFIVAGSGASHTYLTNTGTEAHRIYNLSGKSRIYYLLYAGTSGYYIDNTNTLNIMNAFLNIVAPKPEGDNCSNPQNLASLTSPYNAQTTGYNVDFSSSTCLNAYGDRIFYYDLPNNYVINIGQTTNNYDSRHTLRWGGSCPGTNEVICRDDSDTTQESWTNTTGSTQRIYWINGGHSGTGTFTLSWSVMMGEPSTQAYNIGFSSVTNSSMYVSWSRGNGSNVLVIARSGSSPDVPTDGSTYTASSSYGSGSYVGSGYVVYNGTGSGFTMSNLSSGNTYYIRIFEYNVTGSYVNYLTSTASNNPNSKITIPDSTSLNSASSITSNSFIASWASKTGASGYYLDVSTDINFGSFVSGYNNLYVTSTSSTVSGLSGNSTYYFRVRSYNASGTSSNSGTQTVTTLNNSPTDISLSNSNIAENQAIGSNIGSFSTTDIDSGELYTYSLVSGTGSEDNASFSISGSSLQSQAIFNYESKNSYNIRVNVNDGNGGTFEKSFVISITDINESPQISEITSKSTYEDLTLTFTSNITDPESLSCDLSVSITSTNSNMIPDENIIYSCDTDTYTVTIIPVILNDGVTTIVITANDGQIITQSSFELSINPSYYTLSGQISYYSNSNIKIPDVIMSLTGTNTYTSVSDNSGYYTITNIRPDSYILSVSKSDITNGLDISDAVKILQSSVNLVTLSCEEQISADATLNQKITPLDTSKVIRFVSSTIPCMNDECIKWQFIPETTINCDSWPPLSYTTIREFNTINSDITMQNFIGILIGDVTGNWNP